VLLFNLCGYRLVIDYLQQRHDVKLTAQLDRAEYADEDLISIKTALSLPYYTATMDFERIDGSIRIDGVEYNYVKRRIINDSLELLCLPNTTKQKLQTIKADFFKISNDLQRPESGKKSANLIKSVLLEYCEALTSFSLQAVRMAKQKHLPSRIQFSSSLFALVQEQPPETILTLS
jgi:hypothetical protein